MSADADPDPPVRGRTSRAPRMLLLIDPLLLVAALGLVACSLVTLKGATRPRHPGHPHFYVQRQAIYFGRRARCWRSSSARIDYSRLREFKYALYGMMIALNLVVLGMAAGPGGARGGSRCRSSSFQPSEFGKVLLIVALAASRWTARGGSTSGAPPRGSCCWRSSPALLVIPQPDLGTGTGLRRRRLRDPVLRRDLVEADRPRWWRSSSPRDRDRAGRRAGARRPRAQALPGAAAHRLPAPLRTIHGQPDVLSAPAVADRDRIGPEDRAGRRRDPDEPGLPARATTPTSSSRSWARPTASSAPRSCCRCTRC